MEGRRRREGGGCRTARAALGRADVAHSASCVAAFKFGGFSLGLFGQFHDDLQLPSVERVPCVAALDFAGGGLRDGPVLDRHLLSSVVPFSSIA